MVAQFKAGSTAHSAAYFQNIFERGGSVIWLLTGLLPRAGWVVALR